MMKTLINTLSLLLFFTGYAACADLSVDQELLWDTFDESARFFLKVDDYTCTVERSSIHGGVLRQLPLMEIIYAHKNNYFLSFKDNDNFLQEFIFIDGVVHRQFVYPKVFDITGDGSVLYSDTVISVPENSLSYFYDTVIPLCQVNKNLLSWTFLGVTQHEDYQTISFEVTFSEPVPLEEHAVSSMMLTFDKSHSLPVGIVLKDASNAVIESVEFKNIDVNIGLGAKFFEDKIFEKTQQQGIMVKRTPITEDKLSHDSEELRQFVTTLAKLAMEKFTAIDDYSGQFIRQERMGKKLNPPETIAFKFRKPFDLYMKFVDGPQKNYEILHARGKYKNQMLVHVAGFANLFLPTVELDPAGGLAMMNNRHSMLEFGLGYVIESYYRDLKTAIQYNELSLKYHGTANVDNRPCWIIEAWLPHERDTYYCTRSIMYFDQESYVPTKMIFYDWNPQIKAEELIEQYTYSNLSFNNGFTDEDFDRNNKEYKF